MSKYSQLVDEQAKVMGVHSVPVVENDDPYASTDGKQIFVNSGFFSQVEASSGEGGLRFILAHELGHVHQGMCGGHEGELSCDEFGARSIAVQGYGSEVIHSVMGELNSSDSESHPGSSTRAKRALAAHSNEEGKRELEMPKQEKRASTRFPRQR